MKRLVWLLLLAFGTALAQVSPVDVRVVPAESCGCCDQPSACGMPDCIPPPMSVQPVFSLQSPARTVRLAAKAAAPALCGLREKFYVQFLPRAIVAPVLLAATDVAPAASVPLFQEHCSLLI